jgi:hypothetical protein
MSYTCGVFSSSKQGTALKHQGEKVQGIDFFPQVEASVAPDSGNVIEILEYDCFDGPGKLRSESIRSLQLREG